jgi:hypothetical protein
MWRKNKNKQSSPLKLLGQMEPSLAGSIYVRTSIKLLHLVPFGQQTWPLLLKIEHRVKLHVFGNNSKTVNNIRNFHLVQLFQRSLLKYEKLTDGRRTTDGRQVMAIPHMTLWVRWAKKAITDYFMQSKKQRWRSLLSLTSLLSAPEREVTSPSDFKVVGALPGLPHEVHF